MRKALPQKGEARATSMGSKKRVKFIEPELREAPTESSSPRVIKATLGVAVATPSLPVAPSASVARLSSSFVLVEES